MEGDDMLTAAADEGFVVCESADGWSLHAPGSTDEAIATGEAPPLLDGPWSEPVPRVIRHTQTTYTFQWRDGRTVTVPA